MAQQVINLGATGSGAGGDSARTAFEKAIANFAELYIAALPDTAARKQAAREMFGAENASNLTSGTLPDARVSSTLPADKAFRRGNILGTVSQSGGVPTGALFQRTVTASGVTLRHPDGTQICISQINVGSVASTAASVQTWTYPAAFASVDGVNLTPGSTTGYGYAWHVGLEELPGLTGCNFSYQNTHNATLTLVIQGVAYGRWY